MRRGGQGFRQESSGSGRLPPGPDSIRSCTPPSNPNFMSPHRALLGLYLPGVLTEAVVSALPAELGAYVATSSEPIRISGELRVLGQQVRADWI